MTRDPRGTSAAEPDGGNLHVRIQRGPGLGNRPGLLNRQTKSPLDQLKRKAAPKRKGKAKAKRKAAQK